MRRSLTLFLCVLFHFVATTGASAQTSNSPNSHSSPDSRNSTATPPQLIELGLPLSSLFSKTRKQDGLIVDCSKSRWSHEFRPPRKPHLPTVLFFGGGPSLPILGDDAFPVADEWGLLRFDYPGVGDNASLADCLEWSSEAIAELGIQLLKQHSVGRYFIYGVSYGTVPATIAGHLIEQRRELVLPRFILLESSIGRAFKSNEVLRGYQREWSRAFGELPKRSRKNFRRDTVGQCSPEAWGALIEQALSIGASPGRPSLLVEMLREFTSGEVQLGFCGRAPTQEIGSQARRVYQSVICREISAEAPDHPQSFRLSDLRLEPLSGNVCHGVDFDRRYSVADWPLTVTPVVYVSGDRDPATPQWQMKYHRDRQKAVGRVSITVAEAGHNPLSITLSDCAEEVMNSMMVSTKELTRVLNYRCTEKTNLRVFPPRESRR